MQFDSHRPLHKSLLMQLALLASHPEIDPQNNRFWTQLDADSRRAKDFGRGNFSSSAALLLMFPAFKYPVIIV
jgi:hypothetical protein